MQRLEQGLRRVAASGRKPADWSFSDAAGHFEV